jgi:hypothetical protein
MLAGLQPGYWASVRQAFIRYARCLDSSDHESSFLKLWTLLEFLTKSPGSYEQAAKYVLSIHSEESYHALFIECLKPADGEPTIESERKVQDSVQSNTGQARACTRY